MASISAAWQAESMWPASCGALSQWLGNRFAEAPALYDALFRDVELAAQQAIDALMYDGTLLDITYGAALRSQQHRVPGVFAAFAVKKSYLVANLDTPERPSYVHVFLELLDQKRISVKGEERRYGAEAEVALYGGMPADHTLVLFRLPVIAPNLDHPSDELGRLYGIK
ncbi:hypothetical protein HDU89_006329 [Geranomyces variabilis]|nr:hypothetical protein HDU89_006329 [Geranomyces variabilis]